MCDEGQEPVNSMECPYCGRKYFWDTCQDELTGAEYVRLSESLDKYACVTPSCKGSAVAFAETTDNGCSVYYLDQRAI